MDIDLGDKKVYNVKFNGQAYELREPTVKDASAFADKQKKGDESDMDLFLDFVSALGLPKKEAEKLGISKVKKLVDAIMGDLEKK